MLARSVAIATANSNSSGKMAGIDVDDLLSDESNDSFFEDPKLLAKRGSLTRTPEKKNVADIFGFSEEKQQPKKSEDDWLGLGEATKKPKEQAKKVGFEDDEEILSSLGFSKKREVKKVEMKQGSFEEDEDILSSLGFSKKASAEPEKNPASKKVGLFDDILGAAPKTADKRKVDFEDILAEPKRSEVKEVGLPTREGRRSRTSASALADPLGLFSSEPKPKQVEEKQKQPSEAGDAGKAKAEAVAPPKPKPAQTRSAPNITELPDWLSDAAVKQHKSEPDIPSVSAPKPAPPQEPTIDEEKLQTPMLDAIIAQQKLVTANVGLQNTAIAMQQQESQLMLALQLKKYEEKMIEMQKQQQEILTKQDVQFNDLLQKQFVKQQILEDSMRQQQQRIQNHIDLLIQQPLSGSSSQEKTDYLKRSKEDESEKLYEEIINTLKERQREEMFLLEESYK